MYLRRDTKVKLRVDDLPGYVYFPGPTSAATASTSAGATAASASMSVGAAAAASVSVGAAATASRSVEGATGSAKVGGSLASLDGQIHQQVQFEF